jgi:plasmid maintenance system antidote protein VapI
MARTEPNPTAPQGSQLLRQFIDDSGGSIPSFAEEHDLDRVQLMRLIEGSGAKRVTVNLASRIERATGGAVPVSAWLRRSARRRGAA